MTALFYVLFLFKAENLSKKRNDLKKCHVRETSMRQTASCKLNYCKIGDIFVDVGEERCHGNCTSAGNHSRCWGNGPHLCQRCEF